MNSTWAPVTLSVPVGFKTTPSSPLRNPVCYQTIERSGNGDKSHLETNCYTRVNRYPVDSFCASVSQLTAAVSQFANVITRPEPEQRSLAWLTTAAKTCCQTIFYLLEKCSHRPFVFNYNRGNACHIVIFVIITTRVYLTAHFNTDR